jgi:hypothetical protein
MRLDQAWGGTPQSGAGERSTIGQTQPVDFASFRLSDRRRDEVRLARTGVRWATHKGCMADVMVVHDIGRSVAAKCAIIPSAAPGSRRT